MLARTRPAAGFAAVLAMLVIGVVATAGAQSAKPAPGCAGMSIVDPKGDAKRTSPLGAGAAAESNLDITGIFFTHESGKTYAHMQLVDAHDTLPDGTQGVRWYINFTLKGAQRWVRASHNVGEDTTFQHGHWEEKSRVSDGDTDGKFVTGADGVLRLQVPGAAAGTQVTKIFADTAEVLPNHEEPVTVGVPPGRNNKLYIADRAPDGESAFGTDQQVGTCPSTAPGPNAGGGGGTTPGPGDGPVSPKPNVIDEPAALPVKVATKGGSAKKVSKKKKLALSIEASQPVKDVVATLFTGDPAKPKVIAQAKLGQLSGKGRLSFRIKKKLKKGSISLRVDGTLSDGRKGTANFKVKFGK